MSALNNFEIKTLLAHLWKDYKVMTPQAEHIRELLEERGEVLENDHIALRTFNLEPVGLKVLERVFLDLGYVYTGEYNFDKKKLYARSYSHPSGEFPRIFISELLTERLSESAQKIIRKIVSQVRQGTTGKHLLYMQSLWPKVSLEDYDALLMESEYAGWLAAFGIRANHFTVSVNNLRTFGNLESLNGFLESRRYKLNGGSKPIQGHPGQYLEQSSTLASRIAWEFLGGVIREIPSCYYEFAIRYPVPGSWRLYDGFVAQSADKIFESTDVNGIRQAS